MRDSSSSGEGAAPGGGAAVVERPRARARGLRHEGLVALSGGATFALTAPPTDLYACSLLGLVALAYAIERAPSKARAFLAGVVWASAAGLVGLRFVPVVVVRFTSLGFLAAGASLLLLAVAQALPWAVGAAASKALLQKGVFAPVAFAVATMVALCLPSIFAWTPAGLMSPWPAWIQLADVVGERGVSAILALSAGFSASALRRFRGGERRTAAALVTAALLVPIVLVAYGVLRLRTIAVDTEARVTTGLVDAAVPALDRWNHLNYGRILGALRDRTTLSEREGAELTVWPEAAYPYPLDHASRTAPVHGPHGILGDAHGPVLAGLILEDPPLPVAPGIFERRSYNAATIVTADGARQASADKLALLWFGETVPLGEYFPWLRRTFQRGGGLVPGSEARALLLARATGDARLGVLNCYEDTLADIGRRVVREATPNLLVNVTNDAWFEGTAEPELHLRLSVLRAVEHRLDVVRAVNLGVAAWIDARGVIRARQREAGTVLIARPSLRDPRPTFYGRFGDIPVWFALAAASLTSARRARRRRAVAP